MLDTWIQVNNLNMPILKSLSAGRVPTQHIDFSGLFWYVLAGHRILYVCFWTDLITKSMRHMKMLAYFGLLITCMKDVNCGHSHLDREDGGTIWRAISRHTLHKLNPLGLYTSKGYCKHPVFTCDMLLLLLDFYFLAVLPIFPQAWNSIDKGNGCHV
jgi:hypothetical protein